MNTSRLQQFYHKVITQQPVTIVFLGGSVTSGEIIQPTLAFPHRFASFLKEKYNNPHIHLADLSLSAVPSCYGLLQANTQLPPLNPDIVFIEFAINDRKDHIHQAAFESLLFKSLSHPSQPALCIINVRSRVGYTCTGYMSAAAAHYNIPAINIGRLLDEAIEKNEMTLDDYYYDGSHPSISGDTFILQHLIDFFHSISQLHSATLHTFPSEPFYCREIAEVTTFPSSFTIKSNTPLHWEAKFRYLLFIYFVDNNESLPSLSLTVDQINRATLSGFQLNGWPHNMVQILKIRDESLSHQVSLTLLPDGKNDSFSILTLGYS